MEKLIQELQQGINRYLQAMMENAMRHPEQMQPMDRNAMRLNSLDLQKLLDKAPQLSRTGAKDAARDLLAKLQDLLENLRSGPPLMGRQQRDGPPGPQMMQGLEDLMQYH